MEIMKRTMFGILAITLLFLSAVASNKASVRQVNPLEIVMNA
ncbi:MULTISPECIES: hypothetical protein [Clostridium]|uniref:Uncharacterized protein n=1 Tax=Clostridium diolis TaxID=223919 RepID=A0AAV3W5U1_9CLOT|nr:MULTISPECIES: hypothetical protein [Clostridium]GEA32993.1 hypothetical protein CDIOL_39160 [Clostridium diolis]